MATSTEALSSAAYFDNPLVGRRDLWQQLEKILDAARRGQKQLVRLEGVSGIGKSHLVAEFARQARGRGAVVRLESCRMAHQVSSYYPWQAIFRSLFGLSEPPSKPTDSPAEQITCQTRRVETVLDGLNPNWLIRLPLLGDLLGFPIPDNSTTATFGPRSRQETLFSLVEQLLQRWAEPEGLLLVLEDVQWLDEASWALLAFLSRSRTEVPVMFLFTHTPACRSWPHDLEEDRARLSHLTIGPLSAGETVEVIDYHLPGCVSPAVVELIQERAGGHPLVVGEVIKLLQSAGSLYQDQAGVWQVAAIPAALPDTVEGLLLARFNHLPGPDRLTLQAAAVIGRFFEVELLAHIHPDRPAPPTLLSQLNDLGQRGFIQPSAASSYCFSQGLTHQVIYQTVSEVQAGRLHQAITVQLEQYQPQAVDRLAYHVSQGEVEEKKLLYLEQAAHRARREYANETALNYYHQLLAIREQWQWRKEMVEILHILGRRAEEKEQLRRLSANLETPTYYTGYLWGRYFEATGHYAKALDSLALALADSRDKDDLPGQIRCLAKLGQIARSQGSYEQASGWYRQALALEPRLNLADPDEAQSFIEVLTGLGRVCLHQGAFAQAQSHSDRALALSRQTGNRAGQAQAYNLLSINLQYQRRLGAALWREEQALQLRRLIGDRRGEGASLCQIAQNLSIVGYYSPAQKLLIEALKILQGVGDRWSEVNIWNDLGIVAQELGDLDQAERCLWRGMAIAREIGDKSGQAFVLSNLGLVAIERTNFKAAGVLLEWGLGLAQAQQDAYLVSFLRGYLSLVGLKQGDLSQAIVQATRSLEIRQALQMHTISADNLAVLAAASLAMEKRRQALTYAEQALAILDGYGGEGPEFPQQDYFVCYQVLVAADQPDRAYLAAELAYLLVQQKANKIHDPGLRRSFLSRTDHQLIIEAYTHMAEG